jgi:hypothetical protein
MTLKRDVKQWWTNPHSKTGRTELLGLVRHEVGHAVAMAAFGVRVKEIKMEFAFGTGRVQGNDNHLPQRDQIIILLAGLAGERINHKRPGSVYGRDGKVHSSITGSDIDDYAHYGGVLDEEDYGDFEKAMDLIDLSVVDEDVYLDGCLKEAWQLLRRNRVAFNALVRYIDPSDDEEILEGFDAAWEYFPRGFNPILRKVKPVTKARCKKAA